MGVENYAVSERGIFELGKGCWGLGWPNTDEVLRDPPEYDRRNPRLGDQSRAPVFVECSHVAMLKYVSFALEGLDAIYLSEVALALHNFCAAAEWKNVRLLNDSADEIWELEEGGLKQIGTRYRK